MIALTKRFEEQMEKFKHLARTVAKRQKGGPVHDLRVVTRRLRVAFWLIRQGTAIKVPAKTRLSFRRLGRSLGKLRQLDVAMRDARRHKLGTARLESLHRESSVELLSFLTSKKQKIGVKELKRIDRELQGLSTFNYSRPMQKLRSNLNCWAKHPTDKSELHVFRIQVKKTLYALEMLGQPALPLTRLKDCLGRAHDLEVLGNYFENATKIRTDEALEIKKSRKLFKPALSFARKKIFEFNAERVCSIRGLGSS